MSTFRYYDRITGETRVKPRYIYAGWALLAGFCVGLLIGHAL
jgi:hypothetical protein